jgi:hypothetical protein
LNAESDAGNDGDGSRDVHGGAVDIGMPANDL